MIKTGDKVKFLNDSGGGVVTGFINKNMATVENQDGFEIPYPVSQLINVNDPALNKGEEAPEPEPEEAAFAEKGALAEKAAPIKGRTIEGKDTPHFLFCFVPRDDTHLLAGEIELFLLNDSNYTLLFHYAHFSYDTYTTQLHGAVAPNAKMKLGSLFQRDLSELPEFCFQLIYFLEEDREWQSPLMKKFRVNPVKFYKEKSFRENSFFERNALMFQITENMMDTAVSKLTDDDFRKVVRAKERKGSEKKPPKQQQESLVEVDLHIHELFDNPSGLSNREILEIQLEKVEREMQEALRSRAERIVFIHGVGQGVLKQEVAKLLKTKFPKLAYQDASFREYGYGATMVMLRRKKH